MKLKLTLIVCISFLLTGCGFHLYNKQAMAPQLATLYVQSNNPYGSLENNLKQSLAGLDIKLADSSQAAPVSLDITNSSLTHDNPALSSSSQATVYTFTYNVTFDLLDKHGKPIINPQTVTVTRTLTLNPNEVLEASSDVDSMKQEMERELVFKIINRLNANNTKKALITHETTTNTTNTESTI